MLAVRPANMLDLSGFRLAGRQAELMPGWRDRLRHHIQTEEAVLATWYERAVAFAGFSVLWEDRAACWCFLADDIPRAAWLPMTRAARRGIQRAQIRRIEADVANNYAPAVRWAMALGMHFEGTMPAYWRGQTFLRFARVNA